MADATLERCRRVRGLEGQDTVEEARKDLLKEYMVLKFEYDPLDHEHAGGHWYHVCLGRIQEQEMTVPPPGQPYECPRCGVELEHEDFRVAQQKGWV